MSAINPSLPPTPSGGPSATNFIRQIVESDLSSGKHKNIITRFPPEPNGFLHLGHAKSICLNFGLARDFDGQCNLRFDDTNPETEEVEYIESIEEDIRWLGGNWGPNLFFASDYFEQLHDWAVDLIKKGFAFVDDQTDVELKASRGDINTPGTNSPFRDRSVEENLDLFRRMRAGEFPDGHCILRAKIDMSDPNPLMRDPPLYRIRKAHHPRTGDKWCIYPVYDYAHGQCDSIEKITHSICTLEFEVHRPLYEWFQNKLEIVPTRQIEFARLNVTYTVLSKRKLISLVTEKYVNYWDDPRMPTISGMRRRGFPPEALRDFCEKVGVAKRNNVVQVELLESCVRDALNRVPRRNAVVSPIKVIITNWPTDVEFEELDVPNHPDNPSMGSRKIKFSRELFIESTDFAEVPPAKWFRLSVGLEVRLRYGYWIKCNEVIRDGSAVVELRCTYDPTTKGGNPPADGRKTKGTLHWVSSLDCVPCEFRMYDRLFKVPNPEEIPEGQTWRDHINPKSLQVVKGVGESSLKGTSAGSTYQFERVGYFAADKDGTLDCPIFNLTVGLSDTWAAQSDAQSKEAQAKEATKLAREKAAAERQKIKDDRAKRAEEKKSKNG